MTWTLIIVALKIAIVGYPDEATCKIAGEYTSRANLSTVCVPSPNSVHGGRVIVGGG